MTATENGFSLIELLIVVAIILIIAAIAIPTLLSSRIAANEASAVGSIQAIKAAEYTYFGAYPTVGYAPAIADLGGTGSPCPASSATACLLDSAVVGAVPGGSAKSGYLFLATGITSGGSALNSAFVAGAAPAVAHTTGNRDFCSTDDGVLRSQLATAGDLPVTVTATCFTYPVSQ